MAICAWTSPPRSSAANAIEAITHTHPRDLPVDETTGEILWRNLATVSNELAAVLDKMIAYHFMHRYQSAREVLADLPANS